MGDQEPVRQGECNIRHESIDEMKQDVKVLVKATTTLEATTGSLVDSMKAFWEKEDKKALKCQEHASTSSSIKTQTGFQWVVIVFVVGGMGWMLKVLFDLSKTVAMFQQHLGK